MRIAVPAETDAGETRVAATPDTVKKFVALGATVAVGAGAGLASGIPDADFEAAGATIADAPGALLEGADIILKVRRPTESELADYRSGAMVVAQMDPYGNQDALARLA
jgi:H+-translocating NAD(P) transhydrogenase subunit alpha